MTPIGCATVLYEGSLSSWTDFSNAMGNARVNFGTHGTGCGF